MKNLTFGYGVFVALILSLIGAALFALLSLSVTTDLALRIIVATLGFSYTAILLARGRKRAGRLASVAAYVLVSAASFVFIPSFGFFAVIHAALIWLIRSVHHYVRPLPALLDFGLSVLALAAAVWAESTGSVFLALWSFFLVQAATAAIPVSLKLHADPTAGGEEKRFDHAHDIAEAALRRIGANPRY